MIFRDVINITHQSADERSHYTTNGRGSQQQLGPQMISASDSVRAKLFEELRLDAAGCHKGCFIGRL